ncbi:MAG: hypothetical protein AAF798_04210, partial [Bacteroidota bacterium]
MKKILSFGLLCLSLFAVQQLHAQECEGAINDTYLHANNIRALLNNSGSLFLDKGGNAQFQAPFTNTNSPNSIFAAGLWLGGINAANELFISTPTYGYAGNSPANRDYDYLPGPLDTDGNLAPNCENWDNVWSV